MGYKRQHFNVTKQQQQQKTHSGILMLHLFKKDFAPYSKHLALCKSFLVCLENVEYMLDIEDTFKHLKY